MPEGSNNLPAVTYYTPVELVGIYRNFLERGKSNNIVWLRGIYYPRANQGAQWQYFYGTLKDVTHNVSVTLKISQQDRARLQPNNLVLIGGIIELNPTFDGKVEIIVNVTRFEIIKDQVYTEDELKRIQLKQKKSAALSKNVNLEIGQVLFEGKRPKIALIIAQTTATTGDFENGLRNARSAIDFVEERIAFTRTQELCTLISRLDSSGFTAIAIYRGGGVDPNTDVDKPEVLEAVVNMKTPFICGVGHEPEKIFMRQVADAWTTTPQGLGQLFSEIVENVAAKRNNSRAALVEEVKKQFIKQIEESNKKNKELLAQIGKLTKQQEEQTKANKQNIEKINEQNKENLKTQQKKNDEALAKFQAQSKQQMETLQKQNAALQKQLEDLSKSQKSTFDKLTEQNKQTNTLLEKERQRSVELERQLAAKPNYTSVFIVIAIIAAAVGYIIAQILK